MDKVSRRFMLDAHLGRLAKYLRMLGVDTAYEEGIDDDVLLETARREGRTILSRDRALIGRAPPGTAHFVAAIKGEAQLAEFLRTFGPDLKLEPMTLCLVCGALLARVAKEDVAGLVPEGVWREQDDYWQCTHCTQIYWRGSHFRRMRGFVDQVLHRDEQ